jgi:hypothetical protein
MMQGWGGRPGGLLASQKYPGHGNWLIWKRKIPKSGVANFGALATEVKIWQIIDSPGSKEIDYFFSFFFFVRPYKFDFKYNKLLNFSLQYFWSFRIKCICNSKEFKPIIKFRYDSWGEVGIGEFHCLIGWTQQQFENYLRIVAPSPMILPYPFPQGWWLTSIAHSGTQRPQKNGPGFKPSAVQVKLVSALSC